MAPGNEGGCGTSKRIGGFVIRATRREKEGSMELGLLPASFTIYRGPHRPMKLAFGPFIREGATSYPAFAKEA